MNDDGHAPPPMGTSSSVHDACSVFAAFDRAAHVQRATGAGIAYGSSVTHERNARRTLLVAIIGSSMAFLDGTVVNVALPVMQRELALDRRGRAVGRRGLRAPSRFARARRRRARRSLGRKRVFLAGVVALLRRLCGVRCGAHRAARDPRARRAGRRRARSSFPEASRSSARPTPTRGPRSRHRHVVRVQRHHRRDRPRRRRMGGDHASWRWLFYFNVPIGVLVLLLAYRGVMETRDETAPRRMDWRGALLVTRRSRRSSSTGSSTRATSPARSERSCSSRSASSRSPSSCSSSRAARRADGAALAVRIAHVRGREPPHAAPLRCARRCALPRAVRSIQVQHYCPTAAGASLLPLVAPRLGR